MTAPPKPPPPSAAGDIAARVRATYERFPYPSLGTDERRLTELARLLWLFNREASYDFAGKTVLDVGTGTGHRVIEAARLFPQARFVAVDACAPPLDVARRTAEAAGVTNIAFRQHDLLNPATDLGEFDVVLCMGVLHHLADPAAGMAALGRHLTPNGLLFAYVYGRQGSYERMRRKQVLALLADPAVASIERRIDMARELGFGVADFGWNLNADDPASRDALIVDSYLNPHEVLFDTDGLRALFAASGLFGFTAYGISCGAHGYLFDIGPDAPNLPLPWTDVTTHLRTPDLVAAYERLSLRDKYRLIELLYEPNGYTLLGYRQGMARWLHTVLRIHRNSFLI